MTATSPEPLRCNLRLIRGALRGRRQASVMVSVRSPAAWLDQASRASQLQQSLAALASLLATDPPATADLSALLHALVALQQHAGLLLFEPVQALASTPDQLQFLLPAAAGRFTLSLQLISTVLKQLDTEQPVLELADWQRLLEQLREGARFGMNTPRLIEAAHALDLPVIWLQADMFQVGHGQRSRWLQSTFTDATSNLSVRLARQKTHTHQRLRQAGLPVADQVVVANVEAAIAQANRFGYPVVIKPSDRDGGDGVFADLRDESALRIAFDAAASVSPNLVLERHVRGRDYRLTIFHGELAWAVERQPAGIAGDGHASIQALIDRANQEPERFGGDSLLKPLPCDDEAQRVLAEEGLSLDAVPEAGRFVPLRRNANVSSGGMPVAVKHLAHPDNIRLAIHAVEALRLDIGGVDLILPDIARSWRETGGVICEVNAQPQLNHLTAPHISRDLLQRLLPQGGRIPLVVIAGAPDDSDLPHWLAARLRIAGYQTGLATPQGIWLDDEPLAGPQPAHLASEILLTHPRAGAAVISVADDSALQQGLFADRFDWLVVDGRAWSGQEAKQRTLLFASFFVGNCHHRLLTTDDSPLAEAGMTDNLRGRRFQSLSRDAMSSLLIEDFGAGKARP